MKSPSQRAKSLWILGSLIVLLAGCAEEDAALASEGGFWNENSADQNQESNGFDGAPGADEDLEEDDDFVPEQEEFLVSQVAATERYVFVPNRAEDSTTVALIDGRNLRVKPIQVGANPMRVEAMDVQGQGSVAFVLSSGAATVAIIRADQGGQDEAADVRLLPVPREVNQLALAPDGRHLIAYIDPKEPLNESASVASLQTLALIRLADEPGEDEVFHLSVTRLIDAIAFTEEGDQAFIVGREGINRLQLADIKADAFLPALDLGLSASQFSPLDQEVVFSSTGRFLAARTSQFAGVGLFELHSVEAEVTAHRLVELDGVPTDLDLVEREGESALLIATIRDQEKVALIEIDPALEAGEEDDSFLRLIDVPGAQAGIGRLSPDESALALFSTLPVTPTVGLLNLQSEQVSTYELRNQIRDLAFSPDNQTAVVVHRRQEGEAVSGEWDLRFRHSHGLTLWDLTTGYRRPILLHGEPEAIFMVETGEGARLYVMLTSEDSSNQGVMRIDLRSHRTDFLRLPRRPTQLGVVAGQVFISQEEATGRITFLDIATNEQRTVSGYELNGGIQ